MKRFDRLIDGLIDFALIVLGIPAAVAESALNRRSRTDRIADRVVERMQAQQPRAIQNLAARDELAKALIKDHRRGA